MEVGLTLRDRFNSAWKILAQRDEPLPPPWSSRMRWTIGSGSGQLQSLWTRRLPGSHRDWSNEAGDLGLNSIVAVGLDWYIRNWAQGIPEVMRPTDNGQAEPLPDHPALTLLRKPQPGIAPSVFWSWVITDYKIFGNAYLRKVRSNNIAGLPTDLQYLPADMVRPVGDVDQPIRYYAYTTDGTTYNIDPADIIHVRYGRDPNDHRIGRSPLMSTLREIATDNTAAGTAYGLLRNNAMPSVIIGPDARDAMVDIDEDSARALKRRLQENFAVDGAGGVAVMQAPYKIDRVSFAPSELALDTVRRLPEERVCAALGLNPMVLGLGSGLDRSTYSNYERAQQAAWEDGMIPLMAQIAESLTLSLLPEYPESADDDYLRFNVDAVRALADDLAAEAQRAERLYKAGIIDRAEAKRIAGLDPTDDDTGTMFPGTTATTSSMDINETANAAGILIRSGFDPGAVANRLGIDIQHTGAAPVTLREEAVAVRSVDTKARPNDSMREAARRALEWKREGRPGGTRVGLARANQIVNGDVLSEDVIVRMYSFFSRHEVDKRAEGFNAGEDGYPSPGRVAWDLWGGDAGYAWSRRLRDKIQRGETLSKSFDEDDGSATEDAEPDPFWTLTTE
jgi:HK97 family phage portal protein